MNTRPLTARRSAALQSIHGAKSWVFASDTVEAALTREGGHLAPVRFHTAGGWVQPFSIAPWPPASLPAGSPAVLKHLRGDFFCAPFGGGNWRGEQHPPHGETACRPWDLVAINRDNSGVELTAQQRLKVRPGVVTKRIGLRTGETNIYSEHQLEGCSGPMCLGHHPMLAFPPENGPGQILLSRWRMGRVCPLPFENPALHGYSTLKPGAAFNTLRRVPLATGGSTDLTKYPARPGYDDLVMVSARPGANIAWSTVTFPQAGWLWFSLKDPRILASTVLWHSNGGRHYPPWNGRHCGVLGIEEVTAYFHYGLGESAKPNPVSRHGIPTVLRLHAARPLHVRTIMGIVPLPSDFDRLRSVRCTARHVTFTAHSGATVRHVVDTTFLKTHRSTR